MPTKQNGWGWPHLPRLSFPAWRRRETTACLTEIKAITAGYPLRGELRISEDFSKNAPETAYIANAIPAPGSVWVDEKLMVRLDLNRGDKLEVGAARLTVAALITQEPDFSIGFINLRPRLLINAVDLPA